MRSQQAGDNTNCWAIAARLQRATVSSSALIAPEASSCSKAVASYASVSFNSCSVKMPLSRGTFITFRVDVGPPFLSKSSESFQATGILAVVDASLA